METSDISIATSTSASVCTSELRVTNPMLSQEGNYSCRATVGGSGQTDSDNSVFNFNFPQAPIITIDPVDPITEYITRNVTITCLFTTLNRFQDSLSINWYQNGTMVSTSENNQISTMNLNATTTESKLTITSLVADNNGMYHCVAQIIAQLNSEEAMSDVINVQVIGIPTPNVAISPLGTISDYIIHNVSITCVFTTLSQFQDNLRINWYQNETNVNTGGNIQISTITVNATTTESILTITSLVVENTGTYYCVGQILGMLNSEEAMSDVINIQVIGIPTPIVRIDSVTPITDYITQNVSITCLVTTLDIFQDALNVDWYQNETLVNTNGNIQTLTMIPNATTTESTLTITSLVFDNAGMYHCVGQILDMLNSEKAMSDVINIQVIGVPTPIVRIDSVTPITDYITQNVSITCLVTTLDIFKDALNVDWYQNGTLVDTSGNIEISTVNSDATTTESVLTIMSLVADNAGMYHCIAQIMDLSNSEEETSIDIIVIVTGPPAPIVTISPLGTVSDYITQNVSITCVLTTLSQFQAGLMVDWYQNGNMVDTSGNIEISAVNSDATTTESVLTITSLTVDNAGMYYCVGQIMALLHSEEVMSNVITVDVTGPPAPNVTINPLGTITEYITHNVSITCVSTTLPQFQTGLIVDWYQNGTMLDTSGNIEISTVNLNATKTESVLTITSLVVDNVGTYHCVAQIIALVNSEEAVSDVITVDVTGPPAPNVAISPLGTISDYITQNVSITCVLTTLSQFQAGLMVDWYQNGNMVDTNGNIEISAVNSDATTTESVLTITSLTVDNAGMYYCVGQIIALVNSEEAMSDVITVDVTGPPVPNVAINPLGTITEYITQNVSITCVSTTLPQFQTGLIVDWYQNGTMLDTSGNIEISTVNLNATKTESVLTITSLVVDNVGTYHCVAQIIALVNSEEAMSDVITVDVTGPPAPNVAISPLGTISDYITQNVSITCVLTTLSQFQAGLMVDWYQDGNMVDTNGNIEISAVNSDATTTESVLTITSLTVDNAGMYYCVGQIMALLHSEEVMSNVITVDVTGPPAPNVTINPLGTITEYITHNVSITCVSTTLPQFQTGLIVDWYQNGTMLDTSGNIEISTVNLNATKTESVLTITSLVVDNVGTYHCVAQIIALVNSEEAMSDVITVDVTGPPVPNVAINPLGTISDYITQNVSITCVSTTLSQFQDNLRINWYQNETNVNTGGNIQISTITVNATTTESILTIFSLVVDNIGSYHCTAQIIDSLNSERAMSQSIIITVLVPPAAEFISISSVPEDTVVVGDEFTLVCQFVTLPIFIQYLSIIWYHDNTPLALSNVVLVEEFQIGTDTLQSSLTIRDVVLSQSGTYSCLAIVYNSTSTTSSLITIEIVRAPTPVFVGIYISTNETLYISDSFSLSCEFQISSIFISTISIIWYHNNRTISSFSNIAIILEIDGDMAISTFSVSEASLDRSGSYFCTAGVAGSDFSYSTHFQVIVLPIPSPEFVSIGLRTQPVYVNGSFQLYCIFTSLTRTLPSISIKWYYNSTELSSCLSRFMIEQTHDNDKTVNSTLATQSSEECQAGSYHCEANYFQLNSVSQDLHLSFDSGWFYFHLVSKS